jgi:hypothetical protein
LLARLDDDDEKTARNAAQALGKLRANEIESALINRLRRGAPPLLMRALVEALGKVGSHEARALLDELAARVLAPMPQASLVRTRPTPARPGVTSGADVDHPSAEPVTRPPAAADDVRDRPADGIARDASLANGPRHRPSAEAAARAASAGASLPQAADADVDAPADDVAHNASADAAAPTASESSLRYSSADADVDAPADDVAHNASADAAAPMASAHAAAAPATRASLAPRSPAADSDAPNAATDAPTIGKAPDDNAPAPASDPELARILDEARLKLARTLDRAQGGRIRADVTPRGALPLLAHCRHGLSRLLADELAPFSPRVLDDETVSLTLRAPLAELFRARTMLRFGFPLPVPRHAELGDAVVAALTSDAAWSIFSQLSDGPLRYRLEWAHAGHRRGLTFRCAAAITQARPALLNDPTASPWEAIVREAEPAAPDRRAAAARPAQPLVSVELWPRGLPDPRFAYRRAHVPASSHPTLAAALARVAGARADDVVWDPFTGAGTELIERARLGPFRRLYGTDLDGAALTLARQNLDSAAVAATLTVADARTFTPPEPPTLILTNPPMGRRVLDRHATGALYRDFLTHAAQLLPSGGRLVWISPRGDETLALAEPLGLRCGLRQRVDMAGFWGELQSFTRGSRAAARFASGRPSPSPPKSHGPPRSRKPRR